MNTSEERLKELAIKMLETVKKNLNDISPLPEPKIVDALKKIIDNEVDQNDN